jgi:hypothetical protein
MDQIIHSATPSVGLIIGSYAAVPYVHLHLEVWRRYCDNVPILIHDDCSPKRDELEELSAAYGAAFHSTLRRMGHTAGDLHVLLHGLDWASASGIEILVKFSRRFVPLVNWQPDLGALAMETQYATYSALCRHYGYGFRTECLALHVPSWVADGGPEVLRRHCGRGKCLVESVVHHAARQVHRNNCAWNKRYELLHPREYKSGAYGTWKLPGDNRREARREFLWHNSSRPRDYYRKAIQYGIECYRERDFAVT